MKEYDIYPTGVVEQVVILLEKGVPKSRIKIIGGANGVPYKVLESQNDGYETLATNDNVVGWGEEKQIKK